MNTIRWSLITFATLGVLGFFFVGCESPEEFSIPEMKACDTLTTVQFISRCDGNRAHCDLRAEAPAGSSATGCYIVIVNVPGVPQKVECVEICQ